MLVLPGIWNWLVAAETDEQIVERTTPPAGQNPSPPGLADITGGSQGAEGVVTGLPVQHEADVPHS